MRRRGDPDRLSVPAVARWLVLSLALVAGLVFVAIAYYGSRRGYSAMPVFFWSGLLLIFVPLAFAVLRERAIAANGSRSSSFSALPSTS